MFGPKVRRDGEIRLGKPLGPIHAQLTLHVHKMRRLAPVLATRA